METSRRAVESYWRSRMIDAATSDEDKVTPVYKLEEICDLFRTSPAGIVKEVSDFLLKRLDHKSPIVKQKALRVIKYGVGKSGPEFRREMQRHSVAVKQLLHYKGQPDPLKGDALNKAVRETAQDALSAIFSTEDNKPVAANEVTHKRMEGFGNTNYVMPPDEKKSFISEVVGLGSASIKLGLSTLAQAHSHSFKNNDSGSGSYRGPTLQRSLTNELDKSDKYKKMDFGGDSQGSSGSLRNVTSGPWGPDSGISNAEAANGDSTSSHSTSKTREERFLETIVTSGGVRLQPTRDALQAFLVEATKMDALALSHALESKLQSPHWQVRMRAICVLEAVLRKQDDEHLVIIASYFSDHVDIVTKCAESPQASLREKATRVLSLLGGGQSGSVSEKPAKVQQTVVEMPDLIDTGDHDLLGEDDPKESQSDHVLGNPSASSPLIDDLFSDGVSGGLSTSAHKTDDDPFADVSFHTGEDKDQGTDLFAGMNVGDHISQNGPIANGLVTNTNVVTPNDGEDTSTDHLLKQLQKTKADLSVWQLVASSFPHRQSLLQALAKLNVAHNSTPDDVVNFVFQDSTKLSNPVTFSDEDLPPFGASHNLALYITVICLNKNVPMTLVDDGSAVNVILLKTAYKLGMKESDWAPTNQGVRAYYGT